MAKPLDTSHPRQRLGDAPFWPTVAAALPQAVFASFLVKRTMLQQTIERLQGLDCQAPIVVCGWAKKQARTFSMPRPSSKTRRKPLRESICIAAPLLQRMFMFCAKEYLDELKNFKQEMADCYERAYAKCQKRPLTQMHYHRAETLDRGKGHGQGDDRGQKPSWGKESTFIPIGKTHALENHGIIPLEIIEVQSGSYLGEDDIVRVEDRFGRLSE